ncbi:MAG TPA: methyl-accepting chemotaxis protein, partial [Burkholderiales bacterium]|nr:methyl-accepting chemotaxis protein [Burkholderiales bacterium]
MIRLLLRPGILFSVQFRNTMRYAISAVLFSVPAGLALWAHPELLRSPFAVAMGVAFLVALYYHVCFYAGAQLSWAEINRLTARIDEKDLTPLPPSSIDAAMLGQVSKGQFGKMIATLQRVHEGWREVVTAVRASSSAVALSAKEIAAGNANLSQRTEQQASTLEETASGMEELAGTVTQNADNCKLASDLAQNAETTARNGASAVHGVVEGMARIDQSSKRMADIIGVIEGIAFQTNILALNAAVEAARAGEQGRGFAVVAGEVRALAQRSADAAKEIKTLIQESVAQIGDGSRQAEAAGKVIDEIVVSVQQVNQLIGEIAVASSEQSAGVGEINKAILQLESVTQQNAALVEEASAASLAFQEQADRLNGLVARFRVEAQAAPAAPVAAVKPRATTLPKPESQAAVRPAARPLPRRAAAAARPAGA